MSTEEKKIDPPAEAQRTSSVSEAQAQASAKKPWWNSILVPGSATQIVIAAALAIAIGLAVSSTVEKIPAAATTLVGIPGRLWLRALRATGRSQLRESRVSAKPLTSIFKSSPSSLLP
jgi:hypothetical protein